MVIQELQKKNLASQTYEEIKKEILSGRLAEGSKIPSENQLSKSLNVSRVVLRVALQMLRDEHIIVTYHGIGSFVANPQNFIESPRTEMNYDKFKHIMEFRSSIEYSAIKRAVSEATFSELQKLKECIISMEEAIDDPLAFTTADYDFHYSILLASHNPFFVKAMDSNAKEVFECLTAMNQMNDSRKWGLELHKKIAKSLIERDSKSAIEILKNNGEYNFARMNELTILQQLKEIKQ